MELTSASSQSWHHHHHYKNRNSYNACNFLALLGTHFNHKPSIRFQLPLHRPLRKPFKTVKPTIPTKTTAPATSDVLRLMDALGVSIPVDVYVSLIKECIEKRDRTGAMELGKHIFQSGIGLDLPSLKRLLLMLVSCGCIASARQLFDRMTAKDCTSWAVIIAGYMDSCEYQAAIALFIQMRHGRYPCDGAVFRYPFSWIVVCILKACANTMNFELGRQMHGWLSKLGYSKNSFIRCSLINFYGKVGCSEAADIAFDEVYCRNSVIWTANIVNACKEERFDEVISAFNKMVRTGIRKNCYTVSSVLRACARMRNGGRQVHADAIKLGLEMNTYVQCGLVDMYGKYGLVEDARKLFGMNGDEKNLACWNSMLACYVQHGFCIEALKLVYRMKAAGLQPKESLLNDVMLACSGKEFAPKQC